MTLDMTGFTYRDGNKIRFNGAFGTVELMYSSARDDNTHSFVTGESEHVESHFTAYLLDNDGRSITIASGLTEDSAIINLYAEHSKYLALNDMGRL